MDVMDKGRSHNGKEPLARRAYERIKDDILSQRLLPRESLVEPELATRYEMSKTPVREAMLNLAREGLLEMNAFRGMRVRDFTAEDAREINEVRELLEPFAVRRAVPRMSEEDKGRLRSLLVEAGSAAERGDQQELSRINQDFHAALAARCGNSRVIETLSQLQDQVRVMALRFWQVRAGHQQEAEEQHAAILEAVEAGDSERAATLLLKHIAGFKEKYMNEWDG